jgi:hypothetical protein
MQSFSYYSVPGTSCEIHVYGYVYFNFLNIWSALLYFLFTRIFAEECSSYINKEVQQV